MAAVWYVQLNNDRTVWLKAGYKGRSQKLKDPLNYDEEWYRRFFCRVLLERHSIDVTPDQITSIILTDNWTMYEDAPKLLKSVNMETIPDERKLYAFKTRPTVPTDRKLVLDLMEELS